TRPDHGRHPRSGSRKNGRRRKVSDGKRALTWTDLEQLVARACALGVCGGEWERVIQLTPGRLFAILAERDRARAQWRRDLTQAVRLGMAGDQSSYRQFIDSLSAEIDAPYSTT